MNRDTASEMVINYLNQQFELPREKIKPEANLFADLGLDSIDALDMVGMLETELKIEVKEEELKKIRTVQDIIDFIMQNINAQGSPANG